MSTEKTPLSATNSSTKLTFSAPASVVPKIPIDHSSIGLQSSRTLFGDLFIQPTSMPSLLSQHTLLHQKTLWFVLDSTWVDDCCALRSTDIFRCRTLNRAHVAFSYCSVWLCAEYIRKYIVFVRYSKCANVFIHTHTDCRFVTVVLITSSSS